MNLFLEEPPETEGRDPLDRYYTPEWATQAPPTPDDQPARWLRFDGWGVPDPSDDFIADAIWRIVYGTPTKVDVRHMVSLAQVFVHLAMHPAGVDVCVKQLRQIRRRLRESERSLSKMHIGPVPEPVWSDPDHVSVLRGAPAPFCHCGRVAVYDRLSGYVNAPAREHYTCDHGGKL